MLAAALAAAVLLATATAAAVRAVIPARPPLAAAVHQALHGTPPPRPAGRWKPLRRQLAGQVGGSLQADLDLAGLTVERFVTRRLGWAAAGFAGMLVFWPAGLASLGVPAALAPAAGILGAAGGWQLAAADVRQTANNRRREMRLALAAWLQLTATLLRSGLAEEQALRTAAAAGSGWPFAILRTALDRALTADLPLWHACEDLGTRLDVVELRQVAADLRIAVQQGASPSTALTTRSVGLRDADMADQQAHAQSIEKRLAIPMVGLALVVAAFVIYPSLVAVLGTG